MRYLTVRNKEELLLKLVAFFTKYPILNGKQGDFLNFASAVSILHANKGKGLKNLSDEQRATLDLIISKMNRKRYGANNIQDEE